MANLDKVMGLNGAVAAGDYAVCVMGHIGVFVETAKADFNDIFKVLAEEAHITPKAA